MPDASPEDPADWADVGRDREGAHLLPVERFEVEEATPHDGSHGFTKRPRFATATLSRLFRRCSALLAGPPVARPHRVRTLWPGLPRLTDRLRYRGFAAVAVFLAWALVFSSLLHAGYNETVDANGRPVELLDCTSSPWRRNNGCGVDGLDCGPFANVSWAFQCPAHCASVKLLNPRGVGPLDVVYQPLVVGGAPGVYRGDSWVCAAALHAGIIWDSRGGCGRIRLVGEQSAFPGSTGSGGLASVPFDSYFPLAYTVAAEDDLACPTVPRRLLLAVSIGATLALALLDAPPVLLFAGSMAIAFVHVGLVSDPPASTVPLAALASAAVGRLLPAAAWLAILYATSVRHTLQGLGAPLEVAALWAGGGLWLGALSNYTLDWIPIQRLTPHDLAQQPGAWVALAGIVVLLAAIVVQQAYALWRERRLPRYLALYGVFVAAILAAVVLLQPALALRIHHYVLALLLLPGTAVQTRCALFYQGLLLGLFVNGIARWGFAAVLETPDALRGDGAFDLVLPNVTAVAGADGLSLSLSWLPPAAAAAVDGISLLVNDVERLRRFVADGSPAAAYAYTWQRASAAVAWPEYFRLAFVRDHVTLDYTKASTWLANGTWVDG